MAEAKGAAASLNFTAKREGLGSTTALLLVAYSRLVSHFTARDRRLRPVRTVALTIDDLPGAVPGSDDAMGDLNALRSWNRDVSAGTRKHHVHAIGFVIERKLQVKDERDARAAILEDWIQAGGQLINYPWASEPS